MIPSHPSPIARAVRSHCGVEVHGFLRAIANGDVYYDPAHTIYEDGETKVRPQWRVNTSKFEEKLAMLYEHVRKVE